MENASKALLIAGGILIGIITISIFYFSFGNVSSLVGETQENTQQKELLAFNSSFEAYNKKAMYGADIISVLNKAIDNNVTYKTDTEPQLADFYVNIVFTYGGKTYSLRDNLGEIQSGYIDRIQNPNKYSKIEQEEMYKFKSSVFKCTGVEYNGTTGSAAGRVKQMTFSVIR